MSFNMKTISLFYCKTNNAFVFTASLNETNSNFINSPLIVPTLYNIGKISLKFPAIVLHHWK